jgi:hypothetical protein
VLIAAQRAEAQRLADEAARFEAQRQAAEVQRQAEEAQRQTAEAERLEAERLAAQAARLEAERIAAERLTAQPQDGAVWDTLAGALGPDIAAEQQVPPPAPARPELPPVPQIPPPPSNGAWGMSAPPPGMSGWTPPPPPGARRPAPGWNGTSRMAAQPGHNGPDGQLRTGIRPCPRCELALSANARFCRRCGLPQG